MDGYQVVGVAARQPAEVDTSSCELGKGEAVWEIDLTLEADSKWLFDSRILDNTVVHFCQTEDGIN